MRKTSSEMKKSVHYSLYGQLLNDQVLYRAFRKVRRNHGAPGIDRQTVLAFEADLYGQLLQLEHELKTRTYQPNPCRRVSIPKPGGGVRSLGIPTVRDRVVQQALLEILQPIFEQDFHPHSFGYRPKRSAQDAVAQVQKDIQQRNAKHVVDMDLSQCFDRLDHDLIISLVRQRVSDSSILNLIRMFLKSGVVVEGVLEPTEVGSPQGGVISPLISNIYLNAFDQEMERRGHRFVRYADDILILCSSQRSAERALRNAVEFLEGELRLTVNQAKTHIAHASSRVSYLGFEIGDRSTRICAKKIDIFLAKVKQMTQRSSTNGISSVITELNQYIRSWSNYFRIANCKSLFRQLAGWIRRRLRALLIAQWKKPDYEPTHQSEPTPLKAILNMQMKGWRISRTPQANRAISNRSLTKLGLFDLGRIR